MNSVGYLLGGVFLAIVAGVVLALIGKITVFRNYTDLFLVFLLGVGSFGTILFAISFTDDPFISIAVGSTTALLALYVVGRTFVDNPNPLLFAIALPTKLALCALFLPNLLSLAVPTGKSTSDRASERHSSLFWFLLFGPIINRLVRDKEGFFNPMRVAGGPIVGSISTPDHSAKSAPIGLPSSGQINKAMLLTYAIDERNGVVICNSDGRVKVVDDGAEYWGKIDSNDWVSLSRKDQPNPDKIFFRWVEHPIDAMRSTVSLRGGKRWNGVTLDMSQFEVTPFDD